MKYLKNIPYCLESPLKNIIVEGMFVDYLKNILESPLEPLNSMFIV